MIICDGFRIGGVERLALDQAYELSEQGKECEIVVLAKKPSTEEDSFENRELDLLLKYRIKLEYISGTRREQFLSLFKIISRHDTIFAHSLKGTVLIWFLRQFKRGRFMIITVIHQLPTLSGTSQLLRRMFYAQFCDRLLIFSKAAKEDWDYRRNLNLIRRLLPIRKQISVCRNGIFLPRLKLTKLEKSAPDFKVERLVYVGRLTSWKGIETFLRLAQFPELSHLDVLIVAPTSAEGLLSSASENLRKRTKIIVGKSFSEVNFRESDLHIYPATYGDNLNFVEGVSINVLEMSYLGIPSLITIGGSKTWPELVEFGLIKEVNWPDLKAISKLILSGTLHRKNLNLHTVRELLDIKHNLHNMLNN